MAAKYTFQGLADAAMGCKTAASEFLVYLNNIKPERPFGYKSVLSSAAAVLRYQFEHSKIDRLASRLENFRGVLNSATLLAVRSNADANHDAIQQHLDFLQSDMQKNFDSINEVLHSLLQDRKALPQTRENDILGWLNYRHMSLRQDEVDTSYEATFDWVLEDSPPGPQVPWDDLASYLRHDTRTPYFICGKAGSGKSTLMKHIASHDKTQSYLQKWAASDNSKLLISQFFFWNLGTGLQKSCEGLLRALLHSVLVEYPEFIPVVFPLFYYNWSGDLDAPNYTELKKAWSELVIKASPFLKLALFIDGVDELDGDHADLSLFLRSLSTPKVKIVVSSRPINECLRIFGHPSLRLERLTAGDMEVFVQGRLASHKVLDWHRKYHPTECGEIVAEIKNKADGVFIWVKLVVKILIKVLDDGGTIADLRGNLHSLPGDLEELYARMLRKIPEDYRQQAYEIFLLLQTWQSAISQESFHDMTLHFAMRPPQESLELPIKPEEHEKMCRDQTAARVRSRCCGLVEVREENGCINYIHRTVADFLKTSEIASDLQKEADTDLKIRLMSACLSVMKTTIHLKLGIYLDAFVALYRQVSSGSMENMICYIAELDKTMTQYQKVYVGHSEHPLHWSVCLSPQDSVEVNMGRSFGPVYPYGLRPLLESADLVTFAARVCFKRYLEAISYEDTVTLVLYTLEGWATALWSKTGVNDAPIPLSDRRDVLLALLSNASQAASETVELLDGILLVMVRDDYDLSEDFAVLIAAFLTTSRDPQRLVENGLFEHHSREDIVTLLHHSNDPRNRELGDAMGKAKYKPRVEKQLRTLHSDGVKIQYDWRPFEHIGNVSHRSYLARRDRDEIFHDSSMGGENDYDKDIEVTHVT